jgi:hypothetical protein
LDDVGRVRWTCTRTKPLVFGSATTAQVHSPAIRRRAETIRLLEHRWEAQALKTTDGGMHVSRNSRQKSWLRGLCGSRRDCGRISGLDGGSIRPRSVSRANKVHAAESYASMRVLRVARPMAACCARDDTRGRRAWRIRRRFSVSSGRCATGKPGRPS